MFANGYKAQNHENYNKNEMKKNKGKNQGKR